MESRELDEGKGTEEASVLAAFGKVHCHFLAQRAVFKLTLSVLPPRHGHQPYDTPHPRLGDTLTWPLFLTQAVRDTDRNVGETVAEDVISHYHES